MRMYVDIAFIIIITLSLLYCWKLNNDNDKLELIIINKEILVAKELQAKKSLEDEVARQNKQIELIKVDYDTNIKKFEEYKKKPRIMEVKSDECEDIKDALDNVRIANP